MKTFFFLITVIFFLASCNGSANQTSTADSLKRASSADTNTIKDTTSYERNNVTGADSTKK